MSEAVRLKPPNQLSSYEAVLRSFGYYERITPEEHDAVRAGLERAVQQAPGNADGWAMLSMIYGEEHRFGFTRSPILSGAHSRPRGERLTPRMPIISPGSLWPRLCSSARNSTPSATQRNGLSHSTPWTDPPSNTSAT